MACLCAVLAADKASRLGGDFVECGVNRGGYSRAVMHFVDFPRLGKTFYLLDTFHGLEDKLISHSCPSHQGDGVLPQGRTGRVRGRELKSGMQLHFLRLH